MFIINNVPHLPIQIHSNFQLYLFLFSVFQGYPKNYEIQEPQIILPPLISICVFHFVTILKGFQKRYLYSILYCNFSVEHKNLSYKPQSTLDKSKGQTKYKVGSKYNLYKYKMQCLHTGIRDKRTRILKGIWSERNKQFSQKLRDNDSI